MPMISWSGGVFATASPLPIDMASARIHAPSKEVFSYLCLPVLLGYMLPDGGIFGLSGLPGRRLDKRSAIGYLFFKSVVANGIGFDIRKINVFTETRTL